MIISRLLARSRIARGARPTFVGAWGLVAADALILAVVMALLWGPFRSVTGGWPVWATSAALFAVCFIPMQAVLIISALWAAKSRWLDSPEDKT